MDIASSERQLSRFQAARERLLARTPKTRQSMARHSRIINMGSEANRSMPFPILIDRGEKSTVYDLDGNAYIDTMLGYGTHVLGHRPRAVEAAIRKQLSSGWLFGVHNEMQEQLASALIDASPATQRVIFCNSGTEATMYAIRAARAFTGRQKIATFDGSYHGAHDYGMLIADPQSPLDTPRPAVRTAGVPPVLLQNHVLLPYCHDNTFDLIEQNRDSLALVMVEGVQSQNPHLNQRIKEFLHRVQALCQTHGILFLVDELITGFRISYGGAQGHYGLVPDLATYGKIMGGGLPIGAVGGREDVMRVFGGPAEEPNGIFSGGSLSGNPLSMVAGHAMVEALKAVRDEVYPYINRQTQRLVDSVNAFTLANDMAAHVMVAGSMFQLCFQRDPVTSAREIRYRPDLEKCFYLQLLDKGVLITSRKGFLSAAHTDHDVDAVAMALRDVLADMRLDGLI